MRNDDFSAYKYYSDETPYAAKSRGFRPGGCSNIIILTFLKADTHPPKRSALCPPVSLEGAWIKTDGTDEITTIANS